MKHIKLYIIIIFIAVVLVCGCVNLEEYIPIEEYDFKISELEEANNIIADKDVEIKGLKREVNTLENDLGLNKEETEKYKYLLANLNNLLSNVYYGYASNENWKTEGFTAFSLRYRDKIFFLITAGHCIHYNFEGLDTGLCTTIKFKQNNGNWIYPELLAYENDYLNNRDYAIFYSDKINSGLDFDINNSYPKFILGNTNKNILKDLSIQNSIPGDSGSPIVDIGGEVIEIVTGDYVTGNYVDIDLVIEAIDNLE